MIRPDIKYGPDMIVVDACLNAMDKAEEGDFEQALEWMATANFGRNYEANEEVFSSSRDYIIHLANKSGINLTKDQMGGKTI